MSLSLPLLSPAAGATSTSPATRTRASLRAISEGSAGHRTSLPGRRRSGARTTLLGLLRGQRAWLRDDRRLGRVPLVGRRIGLGNDGWAAGGALAGLPGLLGQLDHLGRLDLQPATFDPLLGLGHGRLHLGRPERRKLVQLANLLTDLFGPLVVSTVHGISEFEQETSPQLPHSLQLPAQGQ